MANPVAVQQADGGFELLRNYLINDALRIQPPVLVNQIQQETGEDAADLRKSAVSSDAYERQALDYRALQQIASRLGRTDGERFASAGGPVDGERLSDAERSLERLPAMPGNYAPLRKAYAEAFFAAVAQRHVEHSHPGEFNRQRAEMRVVRSSANLSLAESVVAEAKRAGVEAGEELSARAVAASWHSQAESAADEIARDTVLARIREVAAQERHLSADQVIERARMSVRAQGAGGAEARGFQRAGWLPISRSQVEAEIARERQGVQVVAPEVQRAGGMRR